MPSALARATVVATAADLPHMVLTGDRLPPDLRSFEPLREGELDNDTMAGHGFPGNTGASLRALGRITGYMREFGNAEASAELQPGTLLVAATVVHLFDDEDGVERWITDIFVRQFRENVGRPTEEGQELLSAEPFELSAFSDQAVGMRAAQRSPLGIVSSTIVDFRVGRLLGVAFVVSAGPPRGGARPELAEALGRELETQIVRVVLDPR